MSDKKTGKASQYLSDKDVTEAQHPLKTYLFFALVGSSILFLSLVFIYFIWLNHNFDSIVFQMPKSFIVSTVVMITSSFTLSQSLKAFKNDETKQLLITLSLTFFLGILFTGLQIFGWKSLYEKGHFIDGEAGYAFLYVITGLHFLHVVVGLFYLFYLCLKAFDNWNDPIKALVYFSNSFEGLRIDLFTSYWHFVDIMWIVLFFTFLFTL